MASLEKGGVKISDFDGGISRKIVVLVENM